MASKVRYYFAVGGRTWWGRLAISTIRQYGEAYSVAWPRTGKMWERAMKVFNELPLNNKKLVVLRERKNNRPAHSRYITMLQEQGMGQRRRHA